MKCVLKKGVTDEIQSMRHNGVLELVELPEGHRPIGCKLVYKTKRDPKGKIEKFKVRLVAKGFTQREGVDYEATFSPVSSKDSFKVIMALVSHFDMELHQMDVKPFVIVYRILSTTLINPKYYYNES